MANLKIFGILCLYYYFCAVQADYMAAVVEYFPEQDENLLPEDRLQKNVHGYIDILDRVSRELKLDIIVYPESTIATRAPISTHADVLPYSVEVKISVKSLCGVRDVTYLTPLACAAVKYRTYIVVNLYERERCEQKGGKKCPKDGWHFYNTNVVLNRNGSIIARYRKFNLFGEVFMTRPTIADISIFSTDFNETFAMFTCFDILFKQPALDLIYKHGVKSVIYPTMWFSELPFLTALQAQQQWAYATNSTVLAAGANNMKLGSGGTGIYRGTRGPMLSAIVGKNESKAYVSKISDSFRKRPFEESIDQKAKEMDNFFLLSDDLTPYSTKSISPHQTKVNDVVCSRTEDTEFCCSFEMELERNESLVNDGKNHYHYHMVAFTGVRSFTGVYNGGVEICGVVACTDSSLRSCGKRFLDYNRVSWPISFKKITIKAEFELNENRVQYPNSLLSDIRPISVASFDWSHSVANEKISRTYTLTKAQDRLMTFAIYGRDFNRDSPVGNLSKELFYS